MLLVRGEIARLSEAQKEVFLALSTKFPHEMFQPPRTGSARRALQNTAHAAQCVARRAASAVGTSAKYGLGAAVFYPLAAVALAPTKLDMVKILVCYPFAIPGAAFYGFHEGATAPGKPWPAEQEARRMAALARTEQLKRGNMLRRRATVGPTNDIL